MTNNKLDENEWRYEIKFIINKEQENLLYSWIAENKTVFRSYPNRSINSIYYDDFDNKSMVDNLSGISSRIKYRIRLGKAGQTNLCHFFCNLCHFRQLVSFLAQV